MPRPPFALFFLAAAAAFFTEAFKAWMGERGIRSALEPDRDDVRAGASSFSSCLEALRAFLLALRELPDVDATPALSRCGLPVRASPS